MLEQVGSESRDENVPPMAGKSQEGPVRQCLVCTLGGGCGKSYRNVHQLRKLRSISSETGKIRGCDHGAGL